MKVVRTYFWNDLLFVFKVLQHCLFRLFPLGWGLFWHFWLTFRFPPWGIWSKNFNLCQIPTLCPHSPLPHGVYIDRCISLRCKRSILSFLPVYITKKNVQSVIDSAVLHWTTRLMVFRRNAGFGRCYLVSTRHENLLQPELGRGSEKT